MFVWQPKCTNVVMFVCQPRKKNCQRAQTNKHRLQVQPSSWYVMRSSRPGSVSRARRTCRKGEKILMAMAAGISRVVVELEPVHICYSHNCSRKIQILEKQSTWHVPQTPSQFPEVHMELFLFLIMISTKPHLN